MQLRSHGRFDYRPITRRPDYAWPGGRRLAVYVAVNHEHFAFGEGLGAEIVPKVEQPDVLNWSWREYGNRVGAWRLLELFEALDLPASALLNSSIYDHCPEIAAAHRARGDEIVAHGRSNAERQGGLTPETEARLIAETTARLLAEEGTAPAGWLSPWISESEATPDLLTAAGYRYTLNWCMDDQPVPLRTAHGPLLAVPYPQEANDVPAIVVRRMEAPAFVALLIDQFDEMLAQAERQPLVMGIALHPYIMGQPHRLRHLRVALRHIAARRDAVWLTTSGAIARHVAELPEA